MTAIVLRKSGIGFVPYDEKAKRGHAKLREGDFLHVTPKSARSVRQHRLYWKLLSTVQENTERWPTKEALHIAIKIALGHFDLVEHLDGSVAPHPKKTDFESLSAEDFGRYFEDTVNLICTVIIPGLGRDDLLREIHDMVGN